jgi:hypothetical protein
MEENKSVVSKAAERTAEFVTYYCQVCKDETAHTSRGLMEGFEVCVRCKIVSYPSLAVSKKEGTNLPQTDKRIVATRA